MKNKIFRFLCLTLSLIMLLSLSACKKEKKKEKPDTKPSSAESVIEPNHDLSDYSNSDGDIVFDDGYSGDIAVILPYTDGKISEGVKLDRGNGLDDDWGDDIDEDDFGDIDWDEEIDLTPFIPQYGSAVDNNTPTRKINVNNTKDGIVFDRFDGIGTNVYPTQSMLETQKNYKTNQAYLELNTMRFNNTQPSYARTWFQIDWMMTDKAGNDYKKYAKDWESNPDYKAYYNGEYDFESDEIQSCVDYWGMLKEAGTGVELNFGWKVATRIQDWFGADPTYPKESAPRDLDQYADACYKLFLYLYKKGLDNVDILSFYNEPGTAYNDTYFEFSTVGDKRVYWAQMADKCKKRLKADKRTAHIEMWGAENSDTGFSHTSDLYVTHWLYLNRPDILDVYTFHGYMDRGKQKGVDNLFEAALFARKFFGEVDLMSTEYYGGDRGIDINDRTEAKKYNWDLNGGWLISNTGYYLAMANNGWRAMLHWGFTGGYLPDPLNMDPANGDHAAWKHPYDENSASWVQGQFYQHSILNNYVPKNANVHDLDWQGKDLRAGAFTSHDGNDFSLVLEKNEGTNQRLEFDVKLDQSLKGKTINVFRFTFESSERTHKDSSNGTAIEVVNENAIQATVPTLYDTISGVTTRFQYTEKAAEKNLYTVYVFTTIEPIKQLRLYKEGTQQQEQAIVTSVKTNGTVSIEPQLVDCDATSKVLWEIKRYVNNPENKNKANEKLAKDRVKEGAEVGTAAGQLGAVSQNGNTVTYTPPADAENGEIVALRATILDAKGKKTNRFASSMIHIKD